MPHTGARNTGRVLRNATSHTTIANHTTSFQRSFFLSTAKLWNQLPESIRSLPLSSFKKAVHKHLGVPKPPAYYTFGSKFGNILHTRLRTQMSHSNSHRFLVNTHTTPECSCGYRVENVSHFALVCPNFQRQRHQLFRNISQTLNIDFSMIPPEVKLNLFIHGKNLDGIDGHVVAHHFQNF